MWKWSRCLRKMTKRKQTIIVQFNFWPSISKIFKKVLYNQLYRYFTHNNLFSDSQYGFGAKHSTELATVELVDIILQSTDNKELLLAIYMDLSKAFDGLQSSIISNATLLWHQREITLVFHQSLSQRTKYVEVNGIQSSKKLSWRECYRDPFWSQFYSWFMLNDITSASEYFSFILYADDTTLFSTMPYSLPALPNEHNVLINGDLFKVNEWHVSIRSSLNANKTKYMISRSSKKRHNLLSLNLILKSVFFK